MKEGQEHQHSSEVLELSADGEIGTKVEDGQIGDESVLPDQIFEHLFQSYLELQEANRRKTAMLAAATHELKTPLSIMSGACELLVGGKMGELEPSQRQMVTLFQQNCHRLLTVVNSFLTYSAAENGKLNLALTREDIGGIVVDTANYWKSVAESSNVALDWEVPEGLPQIACDRARIQIVLNCLCDNAIKHTPSGGSVKLSVQFHFWDRRFAFASSPCERRRKTIPKINSVRLCVSDTGKGIPAEFHDEIFNEYFQIPGQGKPGVGLGLAIARQIVSAHEGKIWVDSHPGKGSSFHVVLPL